MIVHQAHNSLGNFSYNAFFYDDCQWFYHFHKNFELIHVLSGQVELTLGGRLFCLEAGDYGLILPNELHSYRSPNGSRAWVGVFSADFVDGFDRLVKGKQAKDPRFRCEGALDGYLKALLITQEPPALLTMKSLLYGACGAFLAQVTLEEVTPGRDFLWEVTRYLTQNFREPVTFSKMAEALGYEYHYLSRQFHRHFGMSFRSLLNAYRLDEARRRLLSTDESITRIAFETGFQTVRTFNRAFVKEQGLTPSQFRAHAPRLRQQLQNSDGSFFYAEGQT